MIETITILGKSISLYYLFWFLAVIVALILGILLAKNYCFTYSKAITIVAIAITGGYLLIWATSWAFGGGKLSGFNLVRSVAFLPLLYFFLARLFNISYGKMTDFLAPVGVSCFGVTHFGCVFTGCCHGYSSSWGIYSNVVNTVCFPIQIVEAIVSLMIGGTMFYMAKRGIQKGRLLSWMMVTFGFTRFVLEFFRDNDKIIFNISELALHALATMLVGLFMLMFYNYKNSKKILMEDHDN